MPLSLGVQGIPVIIPGHLVRLTLATLITESSLGFRYLTIFAVEVSMY